VGELLVLRRGWSHWRKPLERLCVERAVPPRSLRLNFVISDSRNTHQERVASGVRLRITCASQCRWSEQNVLPLAGGPLRLPHVRQRAFGEPHS